MGASNVTATKESSWTEARTRLMEEVVGRDNMMAAYHRVRSNQGAPGIDTMTVGELKAHLLECWPRIREELLAEHENRTRAHIPSQIVTPWP